MSSQAPIVNHSVIPTQQQAGVLPASQYSSTTMASGGAYNNTGAYAGSGFAPGVVPNKAGNAEARPASFMRKMRRPLDLLFSTMTLIGVLGFLGSFIAFMALNNDDTGVWWESIALLIWFGAIALPLAYAAAFWRITEGRAHALMFTAIVGFVLLGLALRVYGIRVRACDLSDNLGGACGAAIACLTFLLWTTLSYGLWAMLLPEIFRTTTYDNTMAHAQRGKVHRQAAAAPGSTYNQTSTTTVSSVPAAPVQQSTIVSTV